jgi:TorA maturation chaperone TorD
MTEMNFDSGIQSNKEFYEPLRDSDMWKIAASRRDIYNFLTLGFSPSSEVLASEWENLKFFIKKNNISRFKDLISYLESGFDSQVSGSLETREIEYNRLFVGPYTPLVSPYESMYRDSSGMVMGPSTASVLRIYAQENLMPAIEERDLPDHIATEIEYMAFLCHREYAIWKMKGNTDRDPDLVVSDVQRKEKEFLEEHLYPWVPAFCDKVLQITDFELYHCLASLLKDFIKMEIMVSANHHTLE